METDPYEDLAERFVGHYASLRGALRLRLVADQLGDHLPSEPQRIVDVGGGAGHQGILLARAGHEVTIVDPSEAMLARAARSIAAEPPEVRSRLRLVRAAAVEASSALGGERFDAVLCHAVLPYVDSAGAVLRALGELAGPGALLSLVFKNADALAMRPALEGRWSDALDAFDASSDVGGLGVSTRAHRRAAIEEQLAAAGFQVVTWYGIRIMTDHLVDAPADDLDIVLPVEAEAGRRDPYRALGRLIHMLAVKPHWPNSRSVSVSPA